MNATSSPAGLSPQGLVMVAVPRLMLAAPSFSSNSESWTLSAPASSRNSTGVKRKRENVCPAASAPVMETQATNRVVRICRINGRVFTVIGGLVE